jgi:hypothetical protein
MARSIEQDFVSLRKKKLEAEEAGRKSRALNTAFKQFQAKVINRIESRAGVPEGSDPLDYSMKTQGTLFSVVQKIKGDVDDRDRYVRWALENDEGIQEFLEYLRIQIAGRSAGVLDLDSVIEIEQRFYEAILGTELVEYRHKQDKLNQLVSQYIDDDMVLPPGATFRPDNYISQRSA